VSGADVDSQGAYGERGDRRNGCERTTCGGHARQRADFRKSIAEALEDERCATPDKDVVRRLLADDFRGGASGPCTVGVGPEFPRAVRRFDRAHEHDIVGTTLIHT
jgi:hypothetical protein